jgi:hypothetical protein
MLSEGPLALETGVLAPEFDFDFTLIDDEGEQFIKGGKPYQRPYGSKRIALNVAGKYEKYDDTWLGNTDTETKSEEWPISYHGTGKHNALTIAEEGFKLSQGKNFVYGKGIYSTPELEVAKLYAKEFQFENETYYCLIQNRVNPKYFKVIDEQQTQIGEYWLSAPPDDNSDLPETELIRPYALCIFKK